MKFRACQAYLAVLFAVFFGMTVGTRALDPSTDRILYAVGYGHLDDQWNWTIQDTINQFIPDSLHVNFAYFTNANYTNYTFSFEGAMRYQWIKEYYPSDFLSLSNYIRQGRWHVAGSMITPSDVNIPSPEALIRHSLYANTYWKQTFGQTPTDLLLPDAFGFGYSLPSVAAHCGIKGFSSMRAGPGSGIALPFQNIGRWIGPDGQSMIAVVDPGAYSQPVTANLANDSYHYNRINNMFAASGLYLDYMYFGNSGDQGGGPSAATVSNVCASVQTSNGLVHVLSVSSDQMYRDLTPAQVNQLQPYQGEIVAQTLGTGGYTAHGELKRYNRQCELRAMAAEEAAVVGDWLQAGDQYPQERLTTAWTRILWHDMYDDITGVSIPSAYTFTWNDYLLSLGDFKAIETHGLSTLAAALDTSAIGVPVIVYNPISQARQDLVDATVTFAGPLPPAVRVFDGNGTEAPAQMGTPIGNIIPITFLAQAPAVGVAVYDVRPSASPGTFNTGLSVSTSQIENGRYRVQLNTNGDVTSIFDKLNNRQLLAAPIRWDFLYDLSTSLPAWEIQYNNIVAAPISYLGGPATFRIVENGPARVSLEVMRQNAGSTFIERLRLAAGGAGDRVEWDILANWKTRQTLLKLDFQLAVTNANATYDLGLGAIQRSNNTSRLYEVPAQQWADLSASNGTFGVTLMSDCKYGWDKPSNNSLRLSIFHTPAVASSFGHQATDSFGTHRMLIALMGHTNDWRSGGAAWTAARLNQPLQAFQTRGHGPWAGSFSNSFSFISCDNSNLMVKAVKKAESSSEIVVRLQELSGQTQSALLSCSAPILAARMLDGVENHVASLSPIGGRLAVSIGAYAPMTLALTLGNSSAPLPAVVSSPVTLPFNIDAISTDGNRADGNFDSGYTYPAELMPPTIVRDGILFQLGPTNNGALNSLACAGQSLSLNATGYNQVHFLAAAASSNTTVSFMLDGAATIFTVPKFTGFIGQWSPPSQLTNQEVAWVCTHRHDVSGNNAYNFCYLFKYSMALSPGLHTLTLPSSPNVRIFSMTLSSNVVDEIVPAGGLLGENLAPWADAGPSQVFNAPDTNSTLSVKLDGSKSADPDGQITSYIWTLNGGILATGVAPIVTLPIGTNVILLTVTDDHGQAGVAATTISVLPPLSVTLSASPTNGLSSPLTVQFTGQANPPGGITPSDTTDDHLGTITAQGQNAGLNGNYEMATNAFDNDPATKWLDFATNNPSTRSSWLQYQYANGAQRTVTSYTLTSANDAPERDPANWALLGSNDGSTWVTLDTRTSQVFNTRFQTLTFTIASPAVFNIYRLRIDRVANPLAAVAVQLAEMQLLGLPFCYYYWNFGDGTMVQAANGAGIDREQHTYTNNGTYTAFLGVACGIYTGTNRMRITVGPALQAIATATPSNGVAPLTIQFTGQAMGGRTNPAALDTTDDHLGTITAQGENGGINGNSEIAANAFDNMTGTKWLDFANDYPGTRQSWIQYQHGPGIRYAVSRYTVTSANDATIYPARNPADWRLLGSNDGGVTWSTLDVRTNQVFTSNYQKLAVSFSNSTPYGLYRFQIDKVANPSQAVAVQLAELEFIAVFPSFSWSFGDGSNSFAQNPQHAFPSNGVYNVSLVVSDGLSMATNKFVLVLAPPAIHVSKPAPSQLMLDWPAWASGYLLYTATNLAPPVQWMPVTNAIAQSSTDFYLTLPMESDKTRFFRLSHP